VLLLILECGSESRRLSILQIFGCHITGLSLLLIESVGYMTKVPHWLEMGRIMGI